MGKGRAPCCDKSQVKRGPWSPNEDLRLITFIQKHGHDNWRALPKLAGLLRCGKSCRLRWINYLRPDVKRGNFTKEEEESIIKLHQTLGNKWSKIASHFPGRTDNEIKNVWNTHLKKRLSSKNNDPSGNESNKESSITTSSSTSSISSILSSQKQNSGEVQVEEESDPKRLCDENKLTSHEEINNQDGGDEEINNQDGGDDDHVEKQAMHNEFSPQLAKDPKEQVISTTTSSDSSYGSNVSNGTTSTVQVISRQGDHNEELLMDTLMFDFDEPCDVSDLLSEVNKPDNIEENAMVLDQTLMPLEADNDFWGMLDSFDTNFFETNDNNLDQVHVLDNSKPCDNSIFAEEQNIEIDENKKWLRYLESELGLEGTTTTNEDQNQQVELNQNHAFEEVIVPENNFRNEIEVTPESDLVRLNFSPSYQLWPY